MSGDFAITPGMNTGPTLFYVCVCGGGGGGRGGDYVHLGLPS